MFHSKLLINGRFLINICTLTTYHLCIEVANGMTYGSIYYLSSYLFSVLISGVERLSDKYINKSRQYLERSGRGLLRYKPDRIKSLTFSNLP